MSTTVTYKGQTLTTVENQTKTLNTAGTWVEGDFTLTDVSGGGGDEMYKLIAGTITDSEIDWSKVTDLKGGRFWQSRNLTTVDNPTVVNIGEKCFENCANLTNVEITFTSQLITYCGNAFAYCGKLETVKLHFTLANNADTLFGSGFVNGSGKLHTIILEHRNDNYPDKTLNIRYGSFGGANSLRTLVLKGRNVFLHTDTITSGNFSGIYNNPTESTIYVPQALISSYQTATNWSTLYDRGVTFAPIEGSIYDD